MVRLLGMTAAHPDDVLHHGHGVRIYLQLKAMGCSDPFAAEKGQLAPHKYYCSIL